MSFKKEKIILRICGVLLILSSIIPIGIGIFLTYGKDFIVENIIPGEDVEVISRMVAGGLQTFLTGFIALFEGIAALLAARKDKKAIGQKEIEDAISRVMPTVTDISNPEEILRKALTTLSV